MYSLWQDLSLGTINLTLTLLFDLLSCLNLLAMVATRLALLSSDNSYSFNRKGRGILHVYSLWQDLSLGTINLTLTLLFDLLSCLNLLAMVATRLALLSSDNSYSFNRICRNPWWMISQILFWQENWDLTSIWQKAQRKRNQAALMSQIWSSERLQLMLLATLLSPIFLWQPMPAI